MQSRARSYGFTKTLHVKQCTNFAHVEYKLSTEEKMVISMTTKCKIEASLFCCVRFILNGIVTCINTDPCISKFIY